MENAISNFQKRSPISLMHGVYLYTTLEFLNQLTKIANFFDLTSLASIVSDLIGIATILVPIFILSGILKRRNWGRILILVWFGWETVFALFGFLFLVV